MSAVLRYRIAAAGLLCLALLVGVFFFSPEARRAHDQPATGAGAQALTPADEAMVEPEPRYAEIDRDFVKFADEEVLGFLDKNGTVDAAIFLLKHSDPKEFARLEWQDDVPYRLARKLFGERSAPQFRALLEDKEYAPTWYRVAPVIAFTSRTPESAQAILAYVQRREDVSELHTPTAHRRIDGKIAALRLLGLYQFQDQWTDEVLRQALTSDGAALLAQQWIDHLPNSYSKDKAIYLIQGSGAAGLVFSQKADNLRLVREAYEKETERCRREGKSSPLRGQLVDALIWQELIGEKGMEDFLDLRGGDGLIREALARVGKYQLTK